MNPLQGADFDELQARLRASLAQKAGLAPTDTSAAPPVADAGNPSPGSGPAAPQTTPVNALGMNPDVMKHLVGLLGPEFSPDAYRQAQERDWDKTNRNQMMEGARQILSAQGNVPYQPRPTENNVEQTMLANRRQNILGTTEAAGKLQGMLMQQSLMDSNSPMSRMYQDQIAKMDPDYVAKRYGGPQGLRNVPGFLIKQDMEVRKDLGGIQKTGAETASLGATAAKTTAEIPGVGADTVLKMRNAQPVTSQFVDEVQRNLGVRLTPDMTYGEADKRITEALQARGQDVELMKWRAEHSPAIAPGVLYVGPGVPNPDEARDYREKLAATNKLQGLLNDYQDLVSETSKAGKLVGPDAAKLKAIHGELMAEVRTLIGAKTLTDSDIKLADAIVPPAGGAEGLMTWTPSTIAAINTIREHSKQGIAKVGDSRFYHVFDPSAAFGAEPKAPSPAAPSTKPTPPPSWRPD